MKKLPPDEGVAGDALPRLAEHRGGRHVFVDHRHVTRLAAPRLLEVAVEPLLIWHLFREFADHLALRVERLREQRMARGAQLRTNGCDCPACGWNVDEDFMIVVWPVLDLERAIDVALAGASTSRRP